MRKTTGAIAGDVSLNGVQQTKSHLHLTSYVPQEDVFVPSLTCIETLEFYAGLLLRNASAAERRNKIQDVLDRLDLLEHQQTLVGGLLPGGLQLKGLSGGQRRRLSIAIGIVSSPSIVFMDEPTSGLDSFAAVSVMRFIRDLARDRDHTIIATIHQPRLDIWNMFSKVVLLSKGYLMFEGKPDQIHDWFAGHLGYSYCPDEDGTIPDWCLDLVSVDFAKPQVHELKSLSQEESVFDLKGGKSTMRSEGDLQKASESFSRDFSPAAESHCPCLVAWWERRGVAAGSQVSDSSMFPISLEPQPEFPKTLDQPGCEQGTWSSFMSLTRVVILCQQFALLSWRSSAFITRNPAAVGGRLFTISWVAASVGAVFYNIPDTPQSIPTRFNVLFMSTLVLCLFPYLSVSHATGDKIYFTSDMSSRLYSPWVYYLSKAVVQIPFQLMNVITFVVIVYFMTGLRSDSGALILHLVILVLAFLIFSQFAAILAPSEDLAFIIGVCFVAFNLLFSDFFIRKDQMEFPWLGTLSTASPMKYIFEALTEIEFRDRDYYTPCLQEFETTYPTLSPERQAALPYPKEVISYVLRSMSNEEGFCLVSGNGLLHFLGHHRPMRDTVFILSGFLLGMHLSTFLVLCLVSRNPSKR